MNSCLQRIARALSLCAASLMEEFHTFQPRAAKHHRAAASCTTIAAWKAAVMKARSHPSTRAAHPSDTLLLALARLAAWSSSSSQVERGFAVTSGLRGGQSEDEFLEREGNVLIIKTDPVKDKDRHATNA